VQKINTVSDRRGVAKRYIAIFELMSMVGVFRLASFLNLSINHANGTLVMCALYSFLFHLERLPRNLAQTLLCNDAS
jgi:hypothetical protein